MAKGCTPHRLPPSINPPSQPGNILGLLAPSTSTSGDAGLEVTLQVGGAADGRAGRNPNSAQADARPPPPPPSLSHTPQTQEIDPRSGAIVQSIPLPSADTATGYGLRVDTSFSSGALVRTDDGCNVLLSGYGTSATPGAGVVLENDASVPRTVAVISSGAIDTSTRSWTFAWQASWMPLGGQCRQATDDLGAQPRDAVMLPSGGIILTGKAGAQLPMTRGFDYNVSRFNAATGPFSPLFLDLYNRQVRIEMCGGHRVNRRTVGDAREAAQLSHERHLHAISNSQPFTELQRLEHAGGVSLPQSSPRRIQRLHGADVGRDDLPRFLDDSADVHRVATCDAADGGVRGGQSQRSCTGR